MTVVDTVIPSPRKGEFIALIGAVLQVGSFVTSLVAISWQMHAMSVLSAAGTSDLSQLSGALGVTTIAMTTSLIASVAGLICLCIALASLRCRARWFFWFLVTYSWLLLLAFPIGTAAALFFLIYTLKRRAEFLRPPNQAD